MKDFTTRRINRKTMNATNKIKLKCVPKFAIQTLLRFWVVLTLIFVRLHILRQSIHMLNEQAREEKKTRNESTTSNG